MPLRVVAAYRLVHGGGHGAQERFEAVPPAAGRRSWRLALIAGVAFAPKDQQGSRVGWENCAAAASTFPDCRARLTVQTGAMGGPPGAPSMTWIKSSQPESKSG